MTFCTSVFEGAVFPLRDNLWGIVGDMRDEASVENCGAYWSVRGLIFFLLYFSFGKIEGVFLYYTYSFVANLSILVTFWVIFRASCFPASIYGKREILEPINSAKTSLVEIRFARATLSGTYATSRAM